MPTETLLRWSVLRGWLPPLLAIALVSRLAPASAVLFKEVHCDDIHPQQLTAGEVDLMRLDQPLVLRDCRSADAVFASLSSLIGSPDSLKRAFSHVDVNVYGTGPFQLQLGSSIIPIPKSGTIGMTAAVDRLGGGAFAFGTQAGNPSSQILAAAKLYQEAFVRPAGGVLFDSYFDKFDTNIFSLSADGAGAPFHHHSNAWLYLAAGVKQWFVAPWDYALKKELLWGNPKSFANDPGTYERFLHEPQLYTTKQHAGDVVLVPNAWYHATLSLANYTAGIGGQDHPDNARIHPWPSTMAAFMAAFDSRDWRAALQAIESHDREGDVGILVRKVLLQLRDRDLDGALATYDTLRSDVVDSVAAGNIFQSDVDFLFGEVMLAIVQEALAEEQRDRDRLTTTGQRLLDWMSELLKPVDADSTRFHGGTNVLLHGQCQSLHYQDQHGRSCDDYDAAPALCERIANCSPRTRSHDLLCDQLSGKSHRESCCACGGGRRFTNPASNPLDSQVGTAGNSMQSAYDAYRQVRQSLAEKRVRHTPRP